MGTLPRLIFTMGDVAGIGPEIIARAWRELLAVCVPVVIGDKGWLQRGVAAVGGNARVEAVRSVAEAMPSLERLPCLEASDQNLSAVAIGRVSGIAGRAAYDFICAAIDLTLAGAAQGIVTAPIHKEGLRAAGLPYPGHTEILAERTATRQFAMMLYTERLSVVHVTLHMALREVFRNLTEQGILEKIHLLDTILLRLHGRRPRIGVAALNPHASDGGLFGNEEDELIRPAVETAQRQGIDASGPWPSDSVFARGKNGEFDGIVAMYHDQGHIAIKLMGIANAVNVSVGLPIVRTSVAHGTAYDIAGKGVADASSLVEAAKVAARLAGS